MSMSRSERSSMSPPCTKPWMERKTSRTIRRHTRWNSWARTNWAGAWRNLLCFDAPAVDVHPLINLAVILAFSLFPDRVPPFTLLHGTGDAVVPVESSVRLSELLTSLSITVSLYLLPGVNHIEIVTDLMAPDRRYYQLVYSCIKLEHTKLLGPHWPIEWMLDLQTLPCNNFVYKLGFKTSNARLLALTLSDSFFLCLQIEHFQLIIMLHDTISWPLILSL